MIATGLARAFQFMLLLITLRVATALLPPSEMGKLAIITATVSFFALLLINPVGMFVNRRLYAWNEQGQGSKYLFYFSIYVFGVAIFSMIILLSFSSFLSFEKSISITTYLALVACSILFGSLNQTSIPYLNMFGRHFWFGTLTLATTAASLVLAFIAVSLAQRTAAWWFIGILSGQLLVGMCGLYLLRQTLNPTETHPITNFPFSAEALRGFLNFSWPISIAVSLGWVQSQSYRFVVEHSLGLYNLGLFAAGYGISAGLTAGFESMITTHFQSVFYRQVNAEQPGSADAAWHTYARSVLPSITLTAFLIIGLAPQLTQLLLSEEYIGSYEYVMWGAVAELTRITIAVFALFAHAKMATRILIYPNLLGAVSALFLVWLFVQQYGITGIGPALLLSSLCSLFLTVYITAQFTKIRISIRSAGLPILMGAALILVARAPYVYSAAQSNVGPMIFTLLVTGGLFCIFQAYLLADALQIRSGIDNFFKHHRHF